MTQVRPDTKQALDGAPTAFDLRAACARLALRPEAGDGWLSANARDMIRIAAFAGFDPDEVLRRVAMRAHPERDVNVRTVEAVLDEMDGEIESRIRAQAGHAR
ncbi:hypothetical protein [Nocardioides sp. Leaf285]|uniref:hypothetical protein n=1 Tax=Nocardioides sp. Leaf285 TaxID=1736322 RepID=UPI0007027CF5|nr:hypothetical protein [Nocardioides sp. Leaf285]KQP62994.1 hypothetical protein ASF47_18455 [Nocardioides sp. Leaf285]